MLLKRSLFLTALLMLALFQADCQETVRYYDRAWKPADADKAFYISVVAKKDGKWQQADYYSETRKLARETWYADSALTIKQGVLRTFFINESPESIGAYLENRKDGLFLSYYPDGMMRDSFHFAKGMPYGSCASWYPSGDLQSEMQLDSLGTGSGKMIGLFPGGKLSFKGVLAPGLRKTGNWFYYYDNGNRASVLQYAADTTSQLINLNAIAYDAFEAGYYDTSLLPQAFFCFDQNGAQAICNMGENKTPIYQRGPADWSAYLSSQLSLVMRFADKNKLRGYKAVFLIDASGKPMNVLLDSGSDDSVSKSVKQIFENARKWQPAKHQNRLIPYIMTLTISLNAFVP